MIPILQLGMGSEMACPVVNKIGILTGAEGFAAADSIKYFMSTQVLPWYTCVYTILVSAGATMQNTIINFVTAYLQSHCVQ